MDNSFSLISYCDFVSFRRAMSNLLKAGLVSLRTTMATSLREAIVGQLVFRSDQLGRLQARERF